MRKGWTAKVAPISGDLTLSGLGLSAEHKEILLNEVEIVINNAASVNFDDPLLDALNINYFGCMRILDIVH
jgi:alcohol-forming fatty acyl-CoA reductase